MPKTVINKNKPLVSVIMAEYNTNENLLKSSIKSIINQTYKNIELILIDDCGKNDVKKIVDSFNDKRIKLYRNDTNKGLVASLNKALELSSGEYIARMDTDDESYSNRIEVELNFLESHPDISLVSSNCDYFDGVKIWGTSRNKSELITRNLLLKGTPIIHPTVMMRKNAIIKIGGYLDYNRCEDYATWIELYVNGFKLFRLSDALLKYHLSLEDYKKRTLKTRKGFFKMIDTQYLKLNPSIYQKNKIKIKNILAAIAPQRLIFKYHQKKLMKRGDM